MHKIFSVLLMVLFLQVSLFPPSMATVTDELTFYGIEADQTGVTVYPSKEINIETLAQYIDLLQNGVKVENILYERVRTVSGYSSSTWASPVSYTIKPAQGLMCDAVYQLIIHAGLTSFDELAELSIEYHKSFMVQELLSDDFSSYNTEKPVTGAWNYVQLSTNPAYYGSATVSGDGCLQIATGSSNSSSIAFVHSDYANQKSWSDYTMEYDFTPVNKGSSGSYYRLALFTDKPIDNLNRLAFHPQENGIRIYSDGNYKFQSYNLSVGGTYRFKHVLQGKHYQTYINGAKVIDYTNENGYTAAGAPEIILFGNNATYQFDNIKITKMVEAVDVSVDGQDTKNVAVDAPLTLKFSKDINLNTLQTTCFSIQNAGEFTVKAIDTNTVQIDFAQPLAYKTEYTITISDSLKPVQSGNYIYSELTFKTLPSAFDLDSFTFENGVAKAIIKNNRKPEDVTFMATIAIYNQNNKMLDIAGGIYNLSEGETQTIEKDFQQLVADGTYVKCYVWDGMDRMKTLFEKEIN